MAKSLEKGDLSKDCIDRALAFLTQKNQLKPTLEQRRSLESFVNGKDTFVSLPTGHGKSLIFQLVIPLIKRLQETDPNICVGRYPKNPLLIVIAPLRALMSDQICSCEKLGIKAVKLDEVKTVNKEDEIIFASPETLAGHFNTLKDLEERIVGVVVDESHCVVNWGTSGSGKTPFRVAYSQVGNVRAIVKAPILCLTATASSKTRKKIIQMLHMEKPRLVYLSPDKKNIKYAIEMVGKGVDLDTTFSWLIKDLIDNGVNIKKTIVFCSSFKECGDIYDTLLQCLPESYLKYIAMYHAHTPQRIKDKVLSDIIEQDGQIRLVIATSALGMGVNIPDIHRVIHFGVPEDIESYVQAVGRGGRDGSSVLSVLYYRNYHLCHCDAKMRAFIKNKEHCRRLDILKFFGVKGKQMPVLHNCCDICAKKCACGSCPLELYQSVKIDLLNTKHIGLSRQVSSEQRKTFISVLNDIKSEHYGKASVLGSTFLQSMLEDSVIEELGNDLEHLFTVEDVMEDFPILERQVASEILTVVDDIFADIDTVKDFNDISSMKWDDFYFPDIPETYRQDSSDDSS